MPRCACAAVYTYTTRKLWKCKACTHQFSVTSGTIFASRKLPIRDYLLAIAIFVNGGKGHSALQLSRDLDVQYKTAFVLAHKLREAIGAETKNETVSGEVEVDGAYFGGHVKPANFREKGCNPTRRNTNATSGRVDSFLHGTGAAVDVFKKYTERRPFMGNFREVGRSFVAGFRRHIWHMVPAVFVVPTELYERFVRPVFLSEAWPEHLIVPAVATPWVLLLTVVWTAFLTYRDLYNERREVKDSSKQIISRTMQPDSMENEEALKNIGHGERLYARSSIKALSEFYDDHTFAEADRFAAPHIGKWHKTKCTVRNLSVQSNYKHSLVWGNIEGFSITMNFGKNWKDRVELLTVGNIIEVEGIIDKVDRGGVNLEQCDLISVQPSHFTALGQ